MLTPSYHPLINKTNISQSIEYQLTPTAKSTQFLEESSSMLSLSNYLQQDQSSLCFQHNPKKTKTKIQFEKQRMFNEIQCAQKFFMKHLATEFEDEENSQENESMLLTYSSIKEKKLSVLENSQQIAENENNTNVLEQKQKLTSQSQIFPSRISPKLNQRNNAICTDSIELIELLSIPKDSSPQRNQEIVIKNYETNLTDQITKIQQIYHFFQSNKNLLKRMNILQTQNNSKENKCQNCINLHKQLQKLQIQLQEKSKEIKKYNSLIQKLNSNIFDLKIQNKQLFFENKKYSVQIQKLFQHKNEANTIPRIKTVNFDHLDNSLDQILKQSNGVSSSYTNLSQKTTKLFQNNYKNNDIHNNDEVQNSYLPYDKKIYPQTPMPYNSHLKYKKNRRSINHSDQKMEISISQLRQPKICQISQVKVEKILRENNQEAIHLSDRKLKCTHKSQKNIMRFSDLSKEVNEQLNEDHKMESCKRSSHQLLSQKSPTKAHDFFKIKRKNIEQNLENLKSHPLNKISQEDKDSQTSETKTEKLYGLKRSSTQEPIYEFTDYNMNLNKVSVNHHKSLNRHDSQIMKIHENGEKNSIIYKSFKQIGNLYENDVMKHQSRVEKNINNAGPSFEKYGSNLYQIQETNIYGTLRNGQKSQRNFFSPSPNSLASKRQSSTKMTENGSTFMKLSGLKPQMKYFMR